jgi:hypothetical protein
MITHIVSVYSPISQPPATLLFTLKLSTFPKHLREITHPYSLLSPFIYVQHKKSYTVISVHNNIFSRRMD